MDGNVSNESLDNTSDFSSDISISSNFLPYSTEIEDVEVEEGGIEDRYEAEQPIQVIVRHRTHNAGWSEDVNIQPGWKTRSNNITI